MSEDEIRHEVGVLKLQIFINILLIIIILLSMYVAFDALMDIYETSGIEGILSKIVIVLMFVLMGFVNYITKQTYDGVKHIKALRNNY